MATHSSVLAWRIPGTGEPGGLSSMGSHRVRHNWSHVAAAAAAGNQVRDINSFVKVIEFYNWKPELTSVWSILKFLIWWKPEIKHSCTRTLYMISLSMVGKLNFVGFSAVNLEYILSFSLGSIIKFLVLHSLFYTNWPWKCNLLFK